MSRLVALALLVASTASPAADQAVALNEEGLHDLSAGRPADATRAFEAALALRPGTRVLEGNLAAALALRGEELRKERRAADAIPLLERAVRLRPTRLRYRILLGRARFETGDDLLRVAAREDFASVLAKDPDCLDALVNLGEIAYLARELEVAVDFYRRALALKPSDGDVALRLSKAQRELEVERSFGEVSGKSFLVRYSPSLSQEQAQAVLLLCEEVYGRLAATYDTYPPRTVVTLYTPPEFRSATAMHGWVAGLSDGTIRLTLAPDGDPASLRPTINHEMTHQIVREIAPRAPVWLHEGLAQIEEGRVAAQAEARLRRAGALPEGLLSAEVLRQNDPVKVALFYDAALAFTRYLDETHRGAIQGFLRGLGAGKGEADAFREAFGDCREMLFERWRTGLE